jgi:hypothetical protein
LQRFYDDESISKPRASGETDGLNRPHCALAKLIGENENSAAWRIAYIDIAEIVRYCTVRAVPTVPSTFASPEDAI